MDHESHIKMLGIILLLYLALFSCNNEIQPEPQVEDEPEIEIASDSLLAKVLSVTISGDENQYSFNVEVESPDTGCDQYADWWEVISPDSSLIHRRILAHSHVDEQPFRRSSGPVAISKNETVIIRAHMNNLGYGSQILIGSVSKGFSIDSISTNYAIELASAPPLPGSCTF